MSGTAALQHVLFTGVSPFLGWSATSQFAEAATHATQRNCKARSAVLISTTSVYTIM